MDKEVKVRKYIIRFSIFYLIAVITIALILSFLDMDGNSGSNIGALIAAVMFTLDRFIKENKRIPKKSEKKKLVWFSLFACFAVSAFLLIIFLLIVGEVSSTIQLISTISPIVMLFALIVTSSIYLLILYFFYGSIAKNIYKSLEKKGEI